MCRLTLIGRRAEILASINRGTAASTIVDVWSYIIKFSPPSSFPCTKPMDKSRDRIGELPDAVLDSILSLLPLKCAIRTSILSTRWIHLWKHTLVHATCFDFGNFFAKAQTRQEFITNVNKYIQLHNSKNIHEFRLYFHPGDDHKADAEKWIQFATSKGVKNLSLLFCRELEDGDEHLNLPDMLFNCRSLIHFSVSHVDFTLPSDFAGFTNLITLRLNRVSITDETVESILSNCPLLINLFLRLCTNLGSVKVSGPNLRLKCLSLIATDAIDIDVFAPNLKSLHFYGDVLYGYSFRNITSLEDFFISADGYESPDIFHEFRDVLTAISHIKVLTICSAASMNVTMWKEHNPENLPVTLPNLQELQILIGGQIDEEYLGFTFGFLQETIFPCLERLFIDLSGSNNPWYPFSTKVAEEPSSCVFSNLKLLKINHFCGGHTEMKMVKFFLDRAVALELLVLVVAPNSMKDGGRASHSEKSKKSSQIIHDQLHLLPKRSNNAQILLFEHCEFDTSLRPVHTRSDYYVDGICCN